MISDYFPHAQSVQGLLGGLLIGLAAALMLLVAGRIAGVSGILARAALISPGNMTMHSALAFLIGLPLGAGMLHWLYPVAWPHMPSLPTLLIAGFLVGFGTRMGSGCTSGHGVCGVSRLSQRSIVATLIFMGSGMATVFLMHRLGG